MLCVSIIRFTFIDQLFTFPYYDDTANSSSYFPRFYHFFPQTIIKWQIACTQYVFVKAIKSILFRSEIHIHILKSALIWKQIEISENVWNVRSIRDKNYYSSKNDSIRLQLAGIIAFKLSLPDYFFEQIGSVLHICIQNPGVVLLPPKSRSDENPDKPNICIWKKNLHSVYCNLKIGTC